MTTQPVKKSLTTGVIDAPFFDPVLNGKTTEDLEDYHVLKDTPLEGTIVERLYLGVKDKSNGFTFEVNGRSFTFLSPDEIVKRDVFNGKMYDIFLTYGGMGWIHVYYYIPSTGQFGCRMDGGSSDWDRQANYEQFSSDSYDPSSFPKFKGDTDTAKIQSKVQYSLIELLKLLKND